MKIKDLIEYYNVDVDLNTLLLDHEIALIMPPVDKYNYEVQDGKHVFSLKTGNVTDSITIDEKDKSISVLKEPEGNIAQFYKLYEDGTEIRS